MTHHGHDGDVEGGGGEGEHIGVHDGEAESLDLGEGSDEHPLRFSQWILTSTVRSDTRASISGSLPEASVPTKFSSQEEPSSSSADS